MPDDPKVRKLDRRSRRVNGRDRELYLLLVMERTITELLNKCRRPTQGYDFLNDTLARVQAERVILQEAQAGDPTAQRLRRQRAANET